ncbi:MAG: endonuclease/exonuclease/phosphatase family protein [Alistipes sp.]|nr:endonuclease/exonuclease/phosphatase family protein [Alistipes sp.]
MSNKRETYNNQPFGTPRRRKKRTFLGALFVIVLLAVTISFCVALVIAYLTPYVVPSTFGSLTIVGIFAPILYAAVAVCMLLWLVTGRWKTALLVSVFLLPGIFRFSDFYNIAFMRDVETKPSRSDITLMTFNVRGFYGDNAVRSVDGIVDYIAGIENIDVACFQEFDLMAPGIERLDSLMQERQLSYKNDVTEFGDVVLRSYSRYPIIASGDIAGNNRGTSQWFDIVVKRSIERMADTLRVFNNHLHTMSISADDSQDITEGKIFSDGDRMRSIVDRIANNSSIRVDHVDTLGMVVKQTPYEHIICGDFNDTPMSYVYGKLVDNHHDAFVEVGEGYGYTFRPMYGTLRIDYVLHSEGMSATKYVADESVQFSDHLPVIVTLKVDKSDEELR